MKSLCIYGNVHNAYIGSTSGGGERQMALFVDLFSILEFKVSVVDPTLRRELLEINKIKFYGLPNWDEGFRYLRSIFQRPVQIIQVLKKSISDIYYTRIQGIENLVVLGFAKKNKSKFFYAVSSDIETKPFTVRAVYYFNSSENILSIIKYIFLDISLTLCLRYADVILIQHRNQMINKFKDKCFIIPNIIDPPSQLDLYEKRKDLVFVGALDINKGIKELVKIVEKHPDIKFKVIGYLRGHTSLKYYNKLISFKNIIYLGKCDRKVILYELSKSLALINTSRMEGFSNTFLEAWSVATPVLSLYQNPGNVFEKAFLGKYFHGDIDDMSNEIKKIKYNSNDAIKIISYVVKNHSIERVSQKFSKIF